MPSETKAGLAIVVILIFAFGFIAWNKYGKGLKNQTVASTEKDEMGQPEPKPDTPAPSPEDVPSAFEPEGQQRVAAREEDFLTGQGEPAPGPPSADDWEATPVADTKPGDTETIAQAGDFAGFEAAPETAQPVQTQTAQREPLNELDDPWGDAATATSAKSTPTAPDAQTEVDPWADAAAAQTKTADTSQPEPDPFETGIADPIESAAPAGRVAMQPTPPDPADDIFAQEPVAPPTRTTQAFDPGAFEADADVLAEPKVQPTEPAVLAQPQTAPVAQVGQTQPAPSRESFALEDAEIDFNDVPRRPDSFDPEPAQAQRYDRNGTLGNSDRVVSNGVTRPEPRTNVYTVQSTDTYWSISKKVYSTSRYYRALARYNANVIPDPRRMRPGTELSIPDRTVLEKKYPELFPVRQPVPAMTASYSSRQPPGLYFDRDNRPLYHVGSRDTLSSIAQRHLGRASRWSQIYELNRRTLANAEAIRPGMWLTMPMDASQVSYGR